MAVPLLVELQDTIREGRGLLKDMIRERKEIERLLRAVPAQVDEAVQVRIQENMQVLGEAMTGAMDSAVTRINGTFDRLMKVVQETDKRVKGADRGALEELFRSAIAELEAHESRSEVHGIISKTKQGKTKCACGYTH